MTMSILHTLEYSINIEVDVFTISMAPGSEHLWLQTPLPTQQLYGQLL